MRTLDFRSDTVTTPTPAMYTALARAPLGDDVLGHDPTVLELENRAAAILGKDAGLFFPSGTMANQVAVRMHCQEGDEILLGAKCHIFNYEVGGLALHSRVQAHVIPERNGHLWWSDLAPAIREATAHSPGTSLICLENTHNVLGGRLFPLEEMQRIGHEARARKLRVHLDGARLFNAQVATGIPVADYAACADSVMCCLSKGLASPVGSVLVGEADFIARARRGRKAMGGGMRQAGVLAACGLVSLDTMVDRLGEDHAHAQQLAAGLNASGLIEPVDLATVETNILIAALAPGITDPAQVTDLFAERGLLCTTFPPRYIRLCTHKDVGEAEVAAALAVIDEVAGILGAASANILAVPVPD